VRFFIAFCLGWTAVGWLGACQSKAEKLNQAHVAAGQREWDRQIEENKIDLYALEHDNCAGLPAFPEPSDPEFPRNKDRCSNLQRAKLTNTAAWIQRDIKDLRQEIADLKLCQPLDDIKTFFDRWDTYHPGQDPKCAVATEAKRHPGTSLCDVYSVGTPAEAAQFRDCYDRSHVEVTCGRLTGRVWEAVAKDCGTHSWAADYCK